MKAKTQAIVFALFASFFFSMNSADAARKMSVVTTYNGEVHRGYVVRELSKGYLFRTDDDRTIVIAYNTVKSFRNASSPRQAQPAQPPQPVQPVRNAGPRDMAPSRRQVAQYDRRDSDSYLTGRVKRRKHLALPLILNIVLPFGIGSFVAGDTTGGFLALGLQGGAVLSGVLAFTPLSFLAFLAPFAFLAGYIIPIITVCVHVKNYNRSLAAGAAPRPSPRHAPAASGLHLPRVSVAPPMTLRF